MTYKILAITFEVDAQEFEEDWFNVPKKVCDILGLKPGDPVVLVVEAPSASPKKTKAGLTSERKVYTPEFKDVQQDERIRVTVSHS